MKLSLCAVISHLPRDYWTEAEWKALGPAAGDFSLAIFRAVDGLDVVRLQVLVPAGLEPEALLEEAHSRAAELARQLAAAFPGQGLPAPSKSRRLSPGEGSALVMAGSRLRH